MQAKVGYRDDVDGLRAISVTAVVMFHAAIPVFSNGFLGVDVFFVISGFLISNQIFDQLNSGTFSLFNFYERRARRILPAAFLVYLATFAAAAILMSPAAFVAFARSLISATLFVSNWFFLADVSYFGFAAESKPLLHSWSLSVEEQFYLLFPPMVMFLSGARRVAAVALAFICSVVFARYLSNAGKLDTLFFSSFSRFFEPLLGVLAAFVYRRIEFGFLSSLSLRVIGLAIVGYAIFRTPTANHHREMIVPCIGAAALLLARPYRSDPLFRLLASYPFRTVGKLSYSIYLWHWPVLVFARATYGTLTTVQMITCIALSLALSVASLHLVENPIRFRTINLSRKQLFASTGALMVVLAMLGSTAALRDPNAIAMPPEAQAIAAASGWNMDFYYCFEPHGNDPDAARLAMAKNDKLCPIGAVKGESKDFIVWGDSHAYSDLPAFSNLATERGLRGLAAMYPGCPPLKNTVNIQLGPEQNCASYFEAVLQLAKARNIRTVFFVARWSLYVIGEIGPGHAGIMQFADDWNREPDPEKVFRKAIEDTITALEGRKIVFLKEPPVQAFPVTETMITNANLGRPASFLDERWTKLSSHRKRNAAVDAVFRDAAAKHLNVTIVDATDALCQGDACLATRDGLPLYSDDDHLSHRGSPLVLGPLLSPIFDGLKAKP